MTDDKSEHEILKDFLEREDVIVVTSQENIDQIKEKLDQGEEE